MIHGNLEILWSFIKALAKINDSLSLPLAPVIQPAVLATLTALGIHLLVERFFLEQQPSPSPSESHT